MIEIRNASLQDIPLIQDLTEKVWWPTYSSIVSVEQNRYMLDAIYAKEALQKVMDSGAQKFILLFENDTPQGFASYGLRPEDITVCKLHKLYVLPQNHGKGLGRRLIEEIKKRLLTENIHLLDLNVNRNNPSKSFYEKIGFEVIKEEDVPIGPYWMNDYVMRLVIR